jgi:hypothetical protein
VLIVAWSGLSLEGLGFEKQHSVTLQLAVAGDSRGVFVSVPNVSV